MLSEDRCDLDYGAFQSIIDAPPRFVDVEGIRISPGLLIFQNAFEGKTFADVIEIQNICSRPVSVLISRPSSDAVQIKYVGGTCSICPGLKIFCKVKYKFSKHMAVPHIILPIYINEKPYDYKITVVLSRAEIMVSPSVLDFGCVDANHTSMLKSFFIINNGAQNTRFAVDLGRNELDLAVDPMRGSVAAGQSTEVFVEIMGSNECQFDTEFWIKSNPPQRVGVKGNFIRPELRTSHPDTCGDFTVVDFPAVYFGCKTIKTLLVENFSSSPCMFCTIAEVNDTEALFQVARESVERFQFFEMEPYESRLLPHQKQVIQFSFKPTKRPKDEFMTYFLGFLKICKVNFRDISRCKNEESIRTAPELSTVSSAVLSTVDGDNYFPMTAFSEDVEINLAAITNLRVCLHGEAHVASILTKPEIIKFEYMILNKTQPYHIYIQNGSHTLPLLVRYKKTAFISMKPTEFYLKQSGTIEIVATFKVTQLGNIKTKITFQLLCKDRIPDATDYILVGEHSIPCHIVVSGDKRVVRNALKPRFNMGITPMISNEVGYLTECVTFETDIEIPKMAVACLNKRKLKGGGKDLIAFPNDRLKSLRPWTNPNKCRTIFARLPRIISDDEYMLSDQQLSYRNNQKLYYDKLFKSLYWHKNKATIVKPALYQLTNKINDNLEGLGIPNIYESKLIINAKLQIEKHTPLTPSQLKCITIKPTWIFLGRVAPTTGVVEMFLVNNNNDFAIYVHMVPLKAGITFLESDRFLIDGNTEQEIVFAYNATCVGRYTVPVEITVNKSHVFEINIVAYVVSKIVQCDVQEWVILSTDRSTEFLELKNPLNSHVSFFWESTSPCFQIEPNEGCIPPNKTIVCHAKYKHVARQSDFTEILLISESGFTEYINIIYKKQLVQVVADVKQLRVDEIPLNIPIRRYITLRNFSAEPASFTIVTPNPIWGVVLSPIDGVIPARGDQIVTVSMHFKAAITFSCILSMNIERCGAIDIEFCGAVVFPKLVIEPSYISMKKIFPFAEGKATFKIKNISSLPIEFKCQIENFSEFYVVDCRSGKAISSHDSLQLHPGESRGYGLLFRPTEAAVYGLFLPIVVNDIIGPPQLNARISTLASTYTKQEYEKYELISYVKPAETPKYLSVCKITTTVSKPILKFSKFKMNFIYHHHKAYTPVTSAKIEITNVSTNIAEICIRLDEVAPPFNFILEDGGSGKCYERSYVVLLSEGNSVTFEATFTPDQGKFGSYKADLPIFLHGFYDGCPFNKIKLRGLYPKATITPTESIIYLEPTGLKYVSKYTTKLKIAHHGDHCLVTHEASNRDIGIEFDEGRRLKAGIYKAQVTVVLQPTKPKALDSKVVLSCKCGATCLIRVIGSFESCIPTCHSCFHWYDHLGLNERTPTEESANIDAPSESTDLLDLTKDSTLSIMSGYNMTSMVRNETCFPDFPLPTDTSDYAIYMREILSLVENWLYSQGFNCTRFYIIPEGLANYPQDIESKREGTLQKVEKLPVLTNLIIRLAGKDAKKHISSPIPEKSTEKSRMVYMYTNNDNCIQFLKAQGAFIPHVRPELLLTYEHYILYEETFVKPQSKPTYTDSISFQQRTTQCWLDVILQVYKLYMLNLVEHQIQHFTNDNMKDKHKNIDLNSFWGTKQSPSSTNLSHLSVSRLQMKTVYSKTFCGVMEKHIFDQTLYSKSEYILLQWLEFHFERNRCTLWSPERYGQYIFILNKRKIRLFERDLRDGLVLAAVMASYCPYLRKHLQNMYLSPTRLEQIHHNAGKVVQAWHWLKLSFDITPDTIVTPNIVESLMLVNYMYIVFPGLYPSDTVVLKCCFTEVTEHQISVENDSDSTIIYYVLFFGEGSKYFEAGTQILVLPPKQHSSLTIKFYARSMVKVSAVLVLSGEYPGRKYAKCLAVNLFGIPDITVANYEVNILKNLYEVAVTKINIESPYKVAAKYDAVITADPFSENVSFTKWIPQVKFSLPRRFYSRQSTYEFDNDGKCSIEVNVCCGSPYPNSYWIYFLNPEVGDFALKITITGKMSKKNSEKLLIRLPRGFSSAKCICQLDGHKFVKFCPRTVALDIPRKNNILWNSVKDMLMACVSDANYNFFKKYLALPTGRRLLRLIAESDPDHNSEMDYVFQKSAEFKINYNKNIELKSDETIVIDDMTDDGTTPLLFHIQESVSLMKALIKLEEVTGNETRFYTVILQENECIKDFDSETNNHLLE